MRLDFSENAEEKKQYREEEFSKNDESENGKSIYSDSYIDDDYMSDEELARRIRERKERYRAPDYVPSEPDNRSVNKWVLIAVIAVVFAYFITLVVLSSLGIIDSLTMFLLSLPLGIAGLIIYLIYKKKHPSDGGLSDLFS